MAVRNCFYLFLLQFFNTAFVGNDDPNSFINKIKTPEKKKRSNLTISKISKHKLYWSKYNSFKSNRVEFKLKTRKKDFFLFLDWIVRKVEQKCKVKFQYHTISKKLTERYMQGEKEKKGKKKKDTRKWKDRKYFAKMLEEER